MALQEFDRNFFCTQSVHLTYLLKADKKIINKDLEEKMDLAQKISS